MLGAFAVQQHKIFFEKWHWLPYQISEDRIYGHEYTSSLIRHSQYCAMDPANPLASGCQSGRISENRVLSFSEYLPIMGARERLFNEVLRLADF